MAALTAAGVALQPARRAVWAVAEPVVGDADGATIALHPPSADGPALRVSYILDYGPTARIPRQAHTLAVTPETFAREVAGVPDVPPGGRRRTSSASRGSAGT